MSCCLCIIQHAQSVCLTPREGDGCVDLKCLSSSDVTSQNSSELLLYQLPFVLCSHYLDIKVHLRVVDAAAWHFCPRGQAKTANRLDASSPVSRPLTVISALLLHWPFLHPPLLNFVSTGWTVAAQLCMSRSSSCNRGCSLT